MVKILAIAGSLRKDSFNKKLVQAAVKEATTAGADITYIDLKEYPLPIYDGDIEQDSGIPEHAQTLKKIMAESDGFIIASPEYNSGVSAALKNMIDWTSRPAEGEQPMMAYKGKIAAILSASPGPLGGLKGLYHLRYVLENINVMVLPDQLALRQAHDAFDDNGAIKDERKAQQVADIAKKLVDTAKKLSN